MISLLAVLMIAAPALPDTQQFLADFGAKREGLKALRANFTQVNTQSKDSDTVSGKLFFVQPRRIVFVYPEASLTYLFDNLTVYEYDEAAEQVQIHQLSDDPQTEALFLGFGESAGRLQEAYHIEMFRPEAIDCGEIGMILRPKKDDERDAMFREVRLFLRGEDYVPCRVKIVNDDDSTVIIDVDSHEANPTFEPTEARFFAKPGTQIFQDDKHIETVGPKGLWLPRSPDAKAPSSDAKKSK